MRKLREARSGVCCRGHGPKALFGVVRSILLHPACRNVAVNERHVRYVQRLLARLKVYEHRLSQHASSNGAEQASVQPLDAMERDEGDEQQVFSPMSGPTETAHPQSTALPSNHDPPNATDGSPGADNQETSPSTGVSTISLVQRGLD